MKIDLNFIKQNLSNPKARQYSNLRPLAKDTVSFSSMKKSQFQGIDLAVINKFKAPIEKFNTNEDFQNWCEEKIENENLDNEYLICDSYDQQAEIQKSKIMQDWIEYVMHENEAYTPAIRLLILSSVASGLDYYTNELPPVLDKRILADTLYEITENLKKNKNYTFNFEKIYKNKLFASVIGENNSYNGNLTGWIIIPSEYNDPENFEQNVKKLQMLSHNNWCTKTYNAEPYLSDGDFHIYLENGKPKLGVRYTGSKIAEIQGEKNDKIIPKDYLDTLMEHIEFNDLSDNAIDQIGKNRLIQKFKEKFSKPVEECTSEEIFKVLNIDFEKDENGMIILQKYRHPAKKVAFKDVGIDENKLLENVVEIKGNADFRGSLIKSRLDNLKNIGGNVFLSDVNEFPKGKIKVGRDIYLEDKKLSEDIAQCLTKAKSVFKRRLTIDDIKLMAKEKLSTRQMKVCMQYTKKEGMDFEEAVYEASFSPM